MGEPVQTDQIEFPQQFQGLFARARPRYAPLLFEAREELRTLRVPAAVRPYYTYGVLDHAQPSFMLLPMMYLAMAEHCGGITPAHRRYLPWYMLAMELVAVLDDTVDRTPQRSGRPTYSEHFGESSAAAFSCFLLSEVLRGTAESAPVVLPSVSHLFGELCALQTWEFHSRYPRPSVDVLARWLQLHYDAVTPAVAHSLDSALLLHGQKPVPLEVCTRFGEIMQDVDDIVNITEHREAVGENDDLKMGIVTHPLLAAVRSEPALAQALDALWTPYRAIPVLTREGFAEGLLHCQRETVSQYRAVSDIVCARGVPVTVRKVVDDAWAAVAAAPESLRPCVRDMVFTFVDRLRRVDDLAPVLDRALEHAYRADLDAQPLHRQAG